MAINDMTIDVEELYHAALERDCKMEVIEIKRDGGELLYFIEITENNGTKYTVTLCSDHNWSCL